MEAAAVTLRSAAAEFDNQLDAGDHRPDRPSARRRRAIERAIERGAGAQRRGLGEPAERGTGGKLRNELSPRCSDRLGDTSTTRERHRRLGWRRPRRGPVSLAERVAEFQRALGSISVQAPVSTGPRRDASQASAPRRATGRTYQFAGRRRARPRLDPGDRRSRARRRATAWRSFDRARSAARARTSSF